MKLISFIVINVVLNSLAANLAVDAPSMPQVRELASYRLFGRRWRNFVVPHKLRIEELQLLARTVHGQDPEASLRFFDDGEDFAVYMEWDLHYPLTRPYPEQWLREHWIATVDRVANDRGNLVWQLSDAYGRRLGDL